MIPLPISARPTGLGKNIIFCFSDGWRISHGCRRRWRGNRCWICGDWKIKHRIRAFFQLWKIETQWFTSPANTGEKLNQNQSELVQLVFKPKWRHIKSLLSHKFLSNTKLITLSMRPNFNNRNLHKLEILILLAYLTKLKGSKCFPFKLIFNVLTLLCSFRRNLMKRKIRM